MGTLLILLAILIHQGEGMIVKHYGNKYGSGGMFFNAVICLFSMLFFILTDKNGFYFPPMLFAFGLVSCLMYAAGFGFMYLALQCGSYALTRLIASMSGIIAILYGIVFLEEPAGWLTYLAIGLVFLSVILMNYRKKEQGEKKGFSLKWLIYVFDTYREIARRAAEQIRPNDIVYLTGGSFGYIMLSFLPRDFSYTVVVNSVDIGKELRDFENLEVYIAGGKMRRSGSLVDSLATEFISRLHFDLCFITGAGLTGEFGLSNGTDETAAFQRTVIKNSRKKILLMPGVKIGVDSFIKVCDAEVFDMVITDWECVEEHISALEDKGLQVCVVEEPT